MTASIGARAVDARAGESADLESLSPRFRGTPWGPTCYLTMITYYIFPSPHANYLQTKNLRVRVSGIFPGDQGTQETHPIVVSRPPKTKTTTTTTTHQNQAEPTCSKQTQQTCVMFTDA